MTTNVAFNAMPLPGMAAAPAPLTPADPALVDRFNQAMAPQSVQVYWVFSLAMCRYYWINNQHQEPVW